MNAGIDLLELELRRLPDVVFVAFVDRPDALIVQVLARPSADRQALRERAVELATAHVDRPAIVEVLGDQRPARVRLLAVDTDEHQVEVRLGHEGRTASGRGDASTPYGVASATVAALEDLGADVPFTIEQAAVFEHQEREGVMVVLARAGWTGSLYGAAAAESMQQAAVRATLHALNRHLATAAFLMGNHRSAPKPVAEGRHRP